MRSVERARRVRVYAFKGCGPNDPGLFPLMVHDAARPDPYIQPPPRNPLLQSADTRTGLTLADSLVHLVYPEQERAQRRSKERPEGHLRREGSNPAEVPCSFLFLSSLSLVDTWKGTLTLCSTVSCGPEFRETVRSCPSAERSPTPLSLVNVALP